MTHDPADRPPAPDPVRPGVAGAAGGRATGTTDDGGGEDGGRGAGDAEASVPTGWALLILTANLAPATLFAACAAAMWWASTVRSHGEDAWEVLPDSYVTVLTGSLAAWLVSLIGAPLLSARGRRIVGRVACVVAVLFFLLPVPND
jgi:hypothetical protein